MPAGLRAHVRYPELLLALQADVYGLYPHDQPGRSFYNREDLWTVATDVGRERPTATQSDAADGAELRADEAAGRERRASSSRCCRSRRPTATT